VVKTIHTFQAPSIQTHIQRTQIMNRTLASLAFAVAAVAAAPAFADDITIDPNQFVSSRSRAEVIAELQQFQRGGVNPWADHHDQLQAFVSSKTRAQVTAEYLDARHEVAAMSGEDSGSIYLAEGTNLPAPVLAGDLDNMQ
jgi:hypothetical protein